MSIGIDSLMFTVDMTKLLNKETLERGRVVVPESDIAICDAHITNWTPYDAPGIK